MNEKFQMKMSDKEIDLYVKDFIKGREKQVKRNVWYILIIFIGLQWFSRVISILKIWLQTILPKDSMESSSPSILLKKFANSPVLRSLIPSLLMPSTNL